MRLRFKWIVLLAIAFSFFFGPAMVARSIGNTGEDPSNATSSPAQLSEALTTGFEGMDSGKLISATSPLGKWQAIGGDVRVDDKRGVLGTKCLHLGGGENGTTIELELTEDYPGGGQLTFWVERWTSRNPFSFTIEKQVAGDWNEIDLGDESILVGRSFRSQVKVLLGEQRVDRIRFRVTSPENTGVLIDDVEIAPLTQQKIVSVEIVPMTLPVLSGVDASALVKLKVTTAGTLNPVSVTQVNASLEAEGDLKSILALQPFYGGNEADFQWDMPFSAEQKAKSEECYEFTGSQLLIEGENYLWLGCRLRPTDKLDIDQTISARIDSVLFSNGETKTISAGVSSQRLGVAVRQAGEDGAHTYRIPGLVSSNEGTLIGVYDIRYEGSRDLPGNIDVGMSRSIDGGQTWSPMKVIMDMGSDPAWRFDGVGDPSILVDRNTGTLWVSAIWSHGNRSWVGSGSGISPEETGQWILVKSEDDGLSWSEPINITAQIKHPEWCFLLQGPGRGITLSDGTLVFPAQYQDPEDPQDSDASRLPHSTFIYSQDHGESWQVAKGAWDDTTESQLVELADGELMINARTNRSAFRAVLTSRDLGQTWKTHPTHLKSLVEPGACMASVINVGRELIWRYPTNEIGEKLLLFSNPNSRRGRSHMTIKASTNSGASWPMENQIQLDDQVGFGYSCMAMVDDETVGILYEGSQAHLVFQRVKLVDLLGQREIKNSK